MKSESDIHYRITPSQPEAHLFSVELKIENPDRSGQVVSLPAWIPGSYMIRDFAKNIVTIEATTIESGEAVGLEKLDKQSWRCAPCDGAIRLNYTVYAWDLSVRSAHLDTTHGYFNGTSVFLRVHGQDDLSCSVDIVPPEGDAYQAWQVATTLPCEETTAYSFGRYHAANYDELIDHPVEMGTFTLLEFEARGIPHAMVLTGHHYADTERLARDLTRICEYHIDLFGEAPFERYLFQTMVVGSGYGGLEHRSSTSLMCNRDDLPLAGINEICDGYRTFLGLCSHEYFHSWNVKRIKPDRFVPYDLSQEVHTPLLWAFEGFTSYYDDISLVRCGLISNDSYLELLGQTITRVIRHNGRTKQTVSDSSFDTWTKFYKQDENAPNAIISYYTKGGLIALMLDLKIRQLSDGMRSLDDVMRTLWQRYGKPHIGITPQQMEEVINEVAGESLDGLLELALRSTDELPIEHLLEQTGVSLKLRAASSNTDLGGKEGKAPALPPLALGVRYGSDPLGAKLLNVFDGGAAQTAGLSAGDILIAVDGIRATKENVETLLGYHRSADSVSVHAFRRDELMTFVLKLQTAPLDTGYLEFNKVADERIDKLRSAWLSA